MWQLLNSTWQPQRHSGTGWETGTQYSCGNCGETERDRLPCNKLQDLFVQRSAQLEGWRVEGKRGIGKIGFPSMKWILLKTIAENSSNYQKIWCWRIQTQICKWRGSKREQEKSRNQLDSAGNFKTTGGMLVLICEPSSYRLIKKYMEENFTKIVITEHKTMGISKWGLPRLNFK